MLKLANPNTLIRTPPRTNCFSMTSTNLYTRLLRSVKWKRVRLKQLSEHPYCEECIKSNRYTAATVVHHRIPVASAASTAAAIRLCFDETNLQSLCRECHRQHHNAEHYHTASAHQTRERNKVERFRLRYSGLHFEDTPFS